jgi:tRNA A37 threonylcarbamoyladenosine modification protein TsaB
MALLTAQFLARPGGTRFRAVSSMEAAARAWLESHDGTRATVIGDARRGHLWIGTVMLDPDAPPCEWSLTGHDNLPRLLDACPVLLTPHRDRLVTLCPDSPNHHLQDLIPDAVATARLAWLRESRGSPAEPPVPLYLHPAV